MRPQEFNNSVIFPNLALRYAFYLEIWVGVTLDAAMCFLQNFPWGRLKTLRKNVPDVTFQIMLHGANAMGYTSYPDNIVHKLWKQASKSGVGIFRIFNFLNCTDNLNLGVDAVGITDGFMKGDLSYTGGVSYP